jgi:hypothetical protein
VFRIELLLFIKDKFATLENEGMKFARSKFSIIEAFFFFIKVYTISLFATTLRTVNDLWLISFCRAWKTTTATNALSWNEMPAEGNVKKY